MMCPKRLSSLFAVGFVAAGLVACNAIFGIDDGHPRGEETSRPAEDGHAEDGSVGPESPETDSGAERADGPSIYDAASDTEQMPTMCSDAGANLASNDTAIRPPGPCRGISREAGVIPRGCVPTVDGRVRLSEWEDAVCFPNADMNLYVKYAGDDVYMAMIYNMSCVDCDGIQLNYLPSGALNLGADEFTIAVSDRPYEVDGNRFDARISDGGFVAATPPAEIGVAGRYEYMATSYEWKIPFSALRIHPGAPHAFRMSITYDNDVWPMGLTTNTRGVPDDLSTWATLRLEANRL